ncbi:PfkB domain protein [Desulfurispirillum indicum S5]|uniref:PfkB domain protein n=1 Tax=Desulfurispirillum indicum (strain ATCC BAA-1389 / DSM 22839 / S5) TaxID=653733 RepID=E6W3W6_DESIS|nr:adenosine kinase [Desulfurispirillum indicum]ADU65834.1 PfkB domain protein [Desulfurispirillum indicum S5]
MVPTYHVYGIGNALVDYEYRVSDALLARMGVEKGVMTLVDEARQQEVLGALGDTFCKRASGGSAANTLIAVSQLGGRAFYSCKVASDYNGDFYYRDLVAAGVNTNIGSANREAGVTGTCLVMVSEDAERTMNTHLGITAAISEAELVEEAILDSQYIYMEGYLAPSPSGQQATLKARQIARRHGVKVALTFSDSNMVRFFRKELDLMVGDGVDILFCNEAEALLYTGKADIFAAADALRNIAGTFAVTRGEQGALLWDGNAMVEVPTPRVQPVDTNGAGDMFAGAFLYGITHGLSFPAAGKLACTAAAHVVTQFGPRLTLEQTRQLLEEMH